MDAVELPLPANVAVSKLLVAEGFTRIRAGIEETESRGSPGVVVSGLGNLSPASCSSSKGDLTFPLHSSERNSVSKTEKKTDVVHGTHKILLPNFDDEDCSRQRGCRDKNSSFLVLPECSSKQSRRKAGKVPSSTPCAKRPRTDQVGDSMNLVGSDDNNITWGKNGCNLAKCISAEKSMVKRKHGQDGKRADKRNIRAVVKTKFDPLMGSSSTIGGNNILGIYGLKSDVHDVTKHMDDLSLKDLIDGSYRSPNAVQYSTKKSTSTNENFMLSVKKACSIPPLYCAIHCGTANMVHGSCDRKYVACRLSCRLTTASCVANKTDCDSKDKFIAEMSSSSCKDVLSESGPLANLSNIPLHQPKDIQGRLALPPVNDLDSLISHTPVPPVPYLQRHADMYSSTPTPQNASLPPFPWSLSPSGACKANLDPGKLSTNKNTCQYRWIRIGANTGLFGSADSHSSDQDLMGIPLRELKVVSLPEIGTSRPVASSTVIYPPASRVSSSDCPSEPSFTERHHASSNKCYLEYCFKECMPFGSLDTLGKCQGNEETHVRNCSLFQEKEAASVDVENSKTATYGRTSSPCNFPSNLSVGAENSKRVGHSPRLLAAAQTLCEIAGYCSNGTEKKSQDSSKVRWPRKPSQKAMKAPKPRTSAGKAVDSVAALTKPAGPIKSTGKVSSLKPKVLMTSDKKKNLVHINNVHRGSLKWLAPNTMSGRYPPGKFEGDSVTHTKQLNAADSVKLWGMMPPSIREDRVSNNSQQKLRKSAVANTPTGNQSKDLGKGRSKKD